MTEELQEYLRSDICIDTLEDLCESISKIGPYVSGLSMDSPISANQFRYYLSVAARRGAYRQFHIPKKSGGVRVITAPDGELKEILRTMAFIITQLYAPTHEAMAFVGGLARHSFQVYQKAFELYNELKTEGIELPFDEDSVTLCSLLHDVCKMDEYEMKHGKAHHTQVYYENKKKMHGTKSVDLLTAWGLELTDE